MNKTIGSMNEELLSLKNTTANNKLRVIETMMIRSNGPRDRDRKAMIKLATKIKIRIAKLDDERRAV